MAPFANPPKSYAACKADCSETRFEAQPRFRSKSAHAMGELLGKRNLSLNKKLLFIMIASFGVHGSRCLVGCFEKALP